MDPASTVTHTDLGRDLLNNLLSDAESDEPAPETDQTLRGCAYFEIIEYGPTNPN